MSKTNRLGFETSPYLLQHKDNPVHWHPWGDNALNEARNQGKPILLSIGYAACHWCHVMAHESFENPQIAKLMNELFVNIKVDREERPDIDGVYMTALGLMGEQGGWPLTMFLTPDGEPFWGGTYFPPEARYGRPGFSDILLKVADIFHTQPDNIRQNADAIIKSLKKSKATATDIQINGEVLDRVAQLLYQQIDVVHGGLGRAPKFPQCNALEMILRTWLRHRDGAMLGAVNKSLTAMCQGGIYDHLGGGFARYSTDAQWLAPHFEKMLYDNAQLIDILTLAWQVGGNPLYAIRIEETIAWILREMVVGGGGFAATLDADSEGEEGKFYVWQEAEIDKVLGDNATDFKAAYDVSPSGNWEGKVILNR
ncbi:MAG: thioredoxin domain-containing protein, partial [Alphaproteobacteria bacterium]